jgi:hypothetical protein
MRGDLQRARAFSREESMCLGSAWIIVRIEVGALAAAALIRSQKGAGPVDLLQPSSLGRRRM